MPKNNNRETITLGQPTLAEIKAKLDKQVDKTVRTQSEIAKLAAAVGPNKLAELIDRETQAAIEAGAAKDAEHAAGLYQRRVDPGDVVGLDEVTPDSETAVDGDSKGTDPNAG